jgi:hypothetical protein
MEPDLPVLRPAPLAVDYHRHGWVTSLRHTIDTISLTGRLPSSVRGSTRFSYRMTL